MDLQKAPPSEPGRGFLYMMQYHKQPGSISFQKAFVDARSKNLSAPQSRHSISNRKPQF